jgi:hypothetical protein
MKLYVQAFNKSPNIILYLRELNTEVSKDFFTYANALPH